MFHSMKKIVVSVVAAVVLFAGLASIAHVQDKPKDKPDPAKKIADAKDADEEAIRQSAVAFTTAYNAHDAKAVSELFALKAEFTDEDGNLIKGRQAIEQDFAAMFTKFPKCKIEVDIDSIRILTPNVAIEEGVVRGRPIPGEAANISSYVVIHVKVDGRWQIASVKDFDASAQDLTPNEHLQQLAWMVGNWLEESPDSSIKSTCRWDESQNYLLHDFVLQIAGRASANGSMRIGWDPLSRQLKSWTFNVDSSYSEGLWIKVGDEWVVTVHGVNASGEVTSATNVFRFIDQDTMTWRSYGRVVGGESDEDIPENVIKRHTPSPES